MKGTVTTTGMMGKGPAMPQGKVDPKLPTKKNTTQQIKSEPIPQENTTNFQGTKNLTDEDMDTLNAALSPSVKNALGKIIPEFKPVMDQFGSNEPNVVLPVSIVSNYAKRRYGGNDNEALAAFMEDVSGQMETQQTTNVPPSQPTETAGLMTSPQNMETV